MTRLELFRLKSMWGNFNFDYACSMARGRSGGLISMWDPNYFSKEDIWCDESYIIVKGRWKNLVGNCFMINIYAPQESSAKFSLWNKIADFMQHQDGKFILFGDMNTVRHEHERVCYYTWMNKAATKLSKLDRFLISEDILDALPDIRITALDRLWSDHTPILLHVSKSDFGPSPFKIYNSWLLRDDFDEAIKSAWSSLETNSNDKFQAHDSEVIFSSLAHSTGLCSIDRDLLKTRVSLEEIKMTVWDYGSNKALGPDGLMPQGANSSFFTLIPKVSNPIHIKEFRPISLIGVHYKIIAKILANQLSIVINKIISKEQSAFIAGRQILDGLLILSLHCAILNAINSGLIRGIKLSSSNIMISHLFYADDSIITTEWNSSNLDNIIRILQVFYLASGLKINIHKYNIYGIGFPNDEVADMARRTGCASGSFPFTYLGLPIGSNMNLNSSWQILIDRFHKRLSSWKANMLSIGGLLTLIKAVLGSLGIYYLSI
ncbi:RNA-directed DNA polymerase, eukaryota, reverse transcriptase zinc-binding domain protein [Tanacetum coccineum]